MLMKKYYINNEKADLLIRQLIDSGAIKDTVNVVDGTANNPTSSKQVSNCIKARYDIDISNQRSRWGQWS